MNSTSSATVERDPAGVEPQTPTEKQLASIWREIFGVTDIKVSSDFFELGGNSLTAIKLLSRVEAAFGEGALLPDTLFSTGQLGQIAAAIDSARENGLR